MNTLVVAPNWIGDALMAQPLFTLLKRADPSDRLTVLAPRWVAPVLDAMPEVDESIATDLAHGKLQWSARRTFARDLRARRFDRAFVLPNSFKSALIPWLAGIPRRYGYVGESRYGLLNVRAGKPDAGVPMASRYAALAGLVDLPVETPLPLPTLVVDEDRIRATLARFALDRDRPLYALCPGAEYGPAKRWPARHFAALAARLLEREPAAQIVVLGGRGDRAIADEIVAAAPGPRNLAGETTLEDALALLAASTWVVSNDSGLMHVAAAFRRPQTAIFGSSDPRHTPPLSPIAKTLWLHLDCSPCFERTCPLGHLNCLNGIAPQRVLESMQNGASPPRSFRSSPS